MGRRHGQARPSPPRGEDEGEGPLPRRERMKVRGISSEGRG